MVRLLDSTALISYSSQRSSTPELLTRATWSSRLLSPFTRTEASASSQKTPPAAVLLKKAAKIKSGSAAPNKTKVATLSRAEVQKIAELKMPDLNAASIELLPA